jgi:hypothetical protein
MHTKITLLVLVVSTVTTLSADAGQADQRLETTLTPGTTAWITEAGGREERARIVDIAGSELTIAVGESVRRLRTDDIARIRVRRSDSVLNGALIGAGAAIGTALFMCQLMEPWENCRDDVGPMLRIGAVGAGIGIGVDALIRGRKTIYVAPNARGVQVSFAF